MRRSLGAARPSEAALRSSSVPSQSRVEYPRRARTRGVSPEGVPMPDCRAPCGRSHRHLHRRRHCRRRRLHRRRRHHRGRNRHRRRRPRNRDTKDQCPHVHVIDILCHLELLQQIINLPEHEARVAFRLYLVALFSRANGNGASAQADMGRAACGGSAKDQGFKKVHGYFLR